MENRFVSIRDHLMNDPILSYVFYPFSAWCSLKGQTYFFNYMPLLVDTRH